MPTFTVIDLIHTTPEGPTAVGPDDTEQLVFLRQGDADGACGPYSLLMALLACGVIARDQITYFAGIDRRTSYGKLMACLAEHPGLFHEGTTLDQLTAIIEPIFRRQLDYAASYASGTEARSFVREHVEAGHPVILGIAFADGAHWLVVVGIEYDADGAARRFLLLDPSGAPPAACSWNGAIDLTGMGGRYPYTYWWPGVGETDRVALSEALALWPADGA